MGGWKSSQATTILALSPDECQFPGGCSVRVRDVVALVERAAPRALAEDWDNVGLQVGDPDGDTNGCLLALDVDVSVIREAKQCGAALIIAHHPVILAPVRAVTEGWGPGGKVLAAARAGVSIYVAHTNLDASPTVGVAAALADRLGMPRGPVLMPVGGGDACEGVEMNAEEDGDGGEIGFGLGMICEVPEMTLGALAEYVAGRLGAQRVTLVGDEEGLVGRVALMPGSGGAAVGAAAERVDAMVTGELKYHDAQAARDAGVGAIVAGHYETERPVLDLLAKHLREAAGPELQVAISQICTSPFRERGQSLSGSEVGKYMADMKDQLEKLYELQQIDTGIASREKALRELDDGSASAGKLAAAKKALASRREGIGGLEATMRDKELRLRGAEEEQEARSKQAYGGTIGDPKQLGALQKKIEELGRLKDALEEEVLGLMEEIEGGEAAAAEQEAAVGKLERRTADLKARHTRETARLQEELAGLSGEREGVQSGIDAPLLKQYESIAGKTAGLAVAAVREGSCGGCRVSLPSTYGPKLKNRSELVRCESCRRILYLPEGESAFKPLEE